LHQQLARADNFAVEQGKAEKAIEWMNSYAKKNNKNLEVKREGYLLPTTRFGNFEFISWKGDWSAARSIMLKASSKLNMKVLEAGYHQKGNLLSSFFGVSSEFGKVYRSGTLIGQIELGSKSGKWIVKSERYG
jgi:hypothetical protein